MAGCLFLIVNNLLTEAPFLINLHQYNQNLYASKTRQNAPNSRLSLQMGKYIAETR